MRKMLKSKLHRARVTESNLEYEGSCAIDQDLMDLAGIVPYEMVMICNLNNGERFDTYVIPGKRGSGEVSLNGAAARKGIAGDKIIIFSFRYVHDEELKEYNPKIVVLTDENRPK